MRAPGYPRNLVERRRELLDHGLSEISTADEAEPALLPTLGPTPSPVPTKHPLPLIERAFQFFRGVRPNGRVRSLGAQREQSQDLPRGAPVTDVGVQPVWDSRMVNMRDFLATLETGTDEGQFTFPGSVSLNYVVPQGYTGFLRGFRYFFDPPVAGLAGEFRATLLVDDLVVPDFIAMPFGPMMSDYQDTFVIARAGQSFVLLLDVTAAALAFEIQLRVFLYGNLRLTDGRPTNHEVGERIRTPQVIVTPAPAAAAPGPVAPSSPICPPGTVWDPALQRCMRPRSLLRQAGRS